MQSQCQQNSSRTTSSNMNCLNASDQIMLFCNHAMRSCLTLTVTNSTSTQDIQQVIIRDLRD